MCSHNEHYYNRKQIHVNGPKETANFVWAKVVMTHPTGTIVKIFFAKQQMIFQSMNKIMNST